MLSADFWRIVLTVVVPAVIGYLRHRATDKQRARIAELEAEVERLRGELRRLNAEPPVNVSPAPNPPETPCAT